MPKPFGLPKQALLRSKKEISTVFSQGQYHALGTLNAKTIPSQAGETRFLVSVRRSIGNAPYRNRIRRLVKEVMRRHRQNLEIPHDICFFLTRKSPKISFISVEREVELLFLRLSRKGRS